MEVLSAVLPIAFSQTTECAKPASGLQTRLSASILPSAFDPFATHLRMSAHACSSEHPHT
jgi:hypothetical protein